MKLLRSKDGKIVGFSFRRWNVTALPAAKEYWRICECCTVNEAMVFCQTHSVYVCEHCLLWHGRRSMGGEFILGTACRVMSLSWARQMALSVDVIIPEEAFYRRHSGNMIDELTKTVARAEGENKSHPLHDSVCPCAVCIAERKMTERKVSRFDK